MAAPSGGLRIWAPSAVFWAGQALYGLAATLLVMAVAGAFAMPELAQYYEVIAFSPTSAGQVRLVGWGLIVVAVLLAGGVGWLGFAVGRGTPRTRLASFVVCGVLGCGALAVLILQPWDVVSWLPVALSIAAVNLIALAVAVVVLLTRSLSVQYFELTSGVAGRARPLPTAEPPAAPVAASTSAAPVPPAPPSNSSDYDPFS